MNPTTTRTLNRFLKAAPVKWPAMATKLDRNTLFVISRAMEEDAQRLVLLSAYLDVRAAANSHAFSQRYASKRLVKVRRALGYSYPKQGLAQASW